MMAGLIKSIKKGVPNFFTMLNLFTGCIAILLTFYDPALAGLLILLAGVFDFVDGLAARLLDAYSDFGRELDSLADIVSFGVAPSFILFNLFKMSFILKNPGFSLELSTVHELLILASSFLPALFAGARLAKFNMSVNKDLVFSGLPSPAAGIFIASLGYILFTTDTLWIRQAVTNTGLLLAVNITLSVLMVLPLPMFNIKFRNLRLSENRIRYLFVLPSMVFLVYWGLKSIPLIIVYYILISVSEHLVSLVKKRRNKITG